MELDIQEALRYLGAGGGADEALTRQVRTVAAELMAALRPRWSYRVLELTWVGGVPSLGGVALAGDMAARMLKECDRAAVLVCTLGTEFDRRMRETQARDMARAVMLDACGSAWVEAGCDAAEAELRALAPGKFLTDRFSPGYGDLPLDVQGPLCALVDAQRRLGVYVTQSRMLDPAKTVTAVIGLASTPQPARIRGCDFCAMRKTCAITKEGKHCGA